MAPLILQPGFLRVILALAVVASHLSNLEIGRPAVFAFFALSGFWVMRMYGERYAGAGGVPVFYLSRLLRIWLPFAAAYLGFLAIKAIAFDQYDPSDLGALAVLGIATSGRDVLGVSWSLDIELQFYLLVPVLWIAFERGWTRALAAVAVPLTAIGWWLQLEQGVSTALAYLPGFAAGLLVWHSGWQPRLPVALASAAAFTLAGLTIFAVPDTRALLLKDVPTTLHEDWFGMAWVALLIPFIAFNVRQASSAFDHHLGNYSYALYITHWPVIWLVRQAVELGPIAGKLAALAAVAAVSFAFYVLVDRSAERLRQVIVRRATARRTHHVLA